MKKVIITIVVGVILSSCTRTTSVPLDVTNYEIKGSVKTGKACKNWIFPFSLFENLFYYKEDRSITKAKKDGKIENIQSVVTESDLVHLYYFPLFSRNCTVIRGE